MSNYDKQEIKNAKETARNYIKDTPIAPYECLMNEERNSAIVLLNYIEELETKVKQLGKGQHTLMQSRRKWKRKYYKERRKSKDLQKSVNQLYDDYQDIGKMYFDLDEKVDAVRAICKCRQKYQGQEVEDLTNLILDMLSDEKEKRNE